jgi:hypothetical protein
MYHSIYLSIYRQVPLSPDDNIPITVGQYRDTMIKGSDCAYQLISSIITSLELLDVKGERLREFQEEMRKKNEEDVTKRRKIVTQLEKGCGCTHGCRGTVPTGGNLFHSFTDSMFALICVSV